MEPKDLPSELIEFLRSGRRLDYDPRRCECGLVTLVSVGQLRFATIRLRTENTPHHEPDPHRNDRGHYTCEAVSLVASCEGYDPEFILCWIPTLRQFGTWDDDHRTLKVFPGVTWDDIVADPVPFLNAQWSRHPGQFVAPWQHFPFTPA